MNLDLRLPIGLMFTIDGVLLVGFGLVSDQAIYARSLGANVNLWWDWSCSRSGWACWCRRSGRSGARPSQRPEPESVRA